MSGTLIGHARRPTDEPDVGARLRIEAGGHDPADPVGRMVHAVTATFAELVADPTRASASAWPAPRAASVASRPCPGRRTVRLASVSSSPVPGRA